MSLFFSTGSLLAVPAVSTDDPYATAAIAIEGPLAYWRLGDAGTASLADASGNGHAGSYVGSPSLRAEGLTESWQASDGYACDFAGNGYGQVPHAAAFALAQGSLGFWFRANSLAAEQGLLGKDQAGTTAPDDQMAVRVLADGTLNCFFQRGGAGVDLDTIAGAITAGERHHVVVTWSEKIVRLWLDGRQVAKHEGHTTGLTGNDLPWRFGIRTFDDVPADVAIDEVVLYGRALLFDEVQALSQRIAGMGYRDADALRVVNVSTSAGLAGALASAQPGDHIVLADGTYAGPFTLTTDGTRANPIVVRAANGAAAVTISGGDFELTGDWLILDGVRFTSGGGAEVFGSHCRVTRCENESFTGGFGAIVRPGAHFARVDHCRLGPPAADSGGESFTNQPLRFRVEGTAASQKPMYGLADHLDLLGSAVELGNGRDVFSIGNEVASGVGTYTTLHRSILDQSPFDEGVSLKGTHAFVQHCTFKALVYTQNRWGEFCEWRSNYHQGCEQNDFGKGHWHIGNTYDGHDLRLGSGNFTSDGFLSAGGGTGRPASEGAKIIGCTFLAAAKVDAGQPDWDTGVNAAGAEAEGCTNWSVTYSATYTGTITHQATTTEPFDVAVLLLAADVGPAAQDPLVPPGWK